jgi:hypothetical protein
MHLSAPVPRPPARRTWRRAAALLAVLAAVLGVVAATSGDAGAATLTSKTPVMGPNLLTAAQLAQWYREKHPETPNLPTLGNDIEKLASLFVFEGRTEGVRGDIAFMQSVLETGWFTFPDYGQIRPDFNNFAGIYAFDGRPKGTTCAAETSPSRCFATPAIGVLTQIQLLRSYADATAQDAPNRLISAPSYLRGAAPYWELFGGSSGHAIWASAPDYGTRILALYSDALVRFGARAACLPYFQAAVDKPSGSGYWLVEAKGNVDPIGTAPAYGDVSRLRLNAPLVGAESRGLGTGYWLLGGDGGVFTFGQARFYGSTGAMRLNQPVNGMERTPDSGGYWLVAYDGGIFSFGDAKFFGSTGSIKLNQPVYGMERTRSGNGYWLFAKDGGIFAFGDAPFYGSLGSRPPQHPIVAMQRTRDGRGYWMLDSAGYVYAFGDAKNWGDVGGCTNYKGAARMLVAPDGGGYWIATLDGSIIPFGDARRLGSPAFIGSAPVGLMLQK